MKYTVVPAQVTTVEDRIAGNLGLSQLLLLISPVFLDSVLYILLPPNMHFALYKMVAMFLLLLVCAICAIRIKGKILLLWMVVIARYNLRPKYYLYNKNTLANREQYEQVEQVVEDASEETAKATRHLPDIHIPLPDRNKIASLLENPAANVRYEAYKGGLRVRFTEVKD